MEQFITFLENISPLSEKAKIAIMATCKEKEYPKNHILVSDLALGNKYYFIVNGLLRVFYCKKNNEITDWFGEKNTLLGPLLSSQKLPNAIHSVELLENSTLIEVHIWDLEFLCSEFHEIERLGRLIAIQTAIKLQYKIESMLFMTARQRYEFFEKENLSILQKAPLGHIASYLGMNQVTLSRIRIPKK